MVLVDSKRPFYFILTSLILALFVIVAYQQYQKYAKRYLITIHTGAGPVKINADYAETQEKQEKGLMGKQSLPKNSGMIFIFPDEKNRGFWMKNVLIPLDIIFMDSKGHINEITTMKPCPKDAEVCPTYTSKEPARFAIEVNAGFAVKNRIIEGDILEISGF